MLTICQCGPRLAQPALRGIMANQVPDDVQGELSGAIASLVSVTAIIAPWTMTELFGYFTSESAPVYFPGIPFLVAAVLMVMSVLRFAVARPVSVSIAPPQAESS